MAKRRPWASWRANNLAAEGPICLDALERQLVSGPAKGSATGLGLEFELELCLGGKRRGWPVGPIIRRLGGQAEPAIDYR